MREPPEQPQAGASRPDVSAGDTIRASLARQLGKEPENQYEPPPIPDHVLLQRIGTGAYGDVWLARSALGTLRAVKIVYRDRFEDERPYQREFNGILKYEPLSRTHEGLMALLHVGRNDKAECFYYIMELADPDPAHGGNGEGGKPPTTAAGARPPDAPPAGISRDGYHPRTLRSHLRLCQRLPPDQAAQVALRIAGAVAHLHNHGLVHRDIKPSNVIFVGGRPKLADIGLIAGAGDSRSFVGTEGFIPPEGPGTPQADLYSLGKVLYELATGRDRMDFPQLPPGIGKLPEGPSLLELNEVITRACAPAPADRYASATELAADLNLFLSGRSLRQVRKGEYHVAWLKRFAAVACVFLALAVVSVWFAKKEARLAKERAQQSNERARRESLLRQRAEAAERDSRQQLYTALVEQARATVRSGELGHRVKALEAIQKAGAISNAADLRGIAFAALALPDLQFERQLPNLSDATLAQLDPGFERVALCRGGGPVEVRSLADDRLLAKLPPSRNGPVYFGNWSPDGRFLAVKRENPGGGGQGDIEIWDLAGPRRALFLNDVGYGQVLFHPRAPLGVASLTDATVVTWELPSGKELSRFKLERPAHLLMLSPEGDRFAVGFERGDGSVVSIHNMADGRELVSHFFNDLVAGLDWHPRGRWLGVADHSGWVHLMDSQTGAVHPLGRHKAQAVCAVFSPDGTYLISGGWERELICWEVRSREKAFEMALGSFWCQFSADGRHCRTSPRPGPQLYSFEAPTCCRECGEDLGGRIRSAAFSSDGRWLAAAGKGRLGVWDLSNGGPGALVDLTKETGNARPFFASGSPNLFASGDTYAAGWMVGPGPDPLTPPQLTPLKLPKPPGFTSVCVASNQLIFTGSKGSQVVATEDLEMAGGAAWRRTSQGVTAAFGDGRWLGVYRPFSASLYVYRLPGLEAVATLNNKANIAHFAFCDETGELAVASASRVEFWSTVTWQRTRELAGFMDVLFSPRSGTFWLTKDYRTAGLYASRTLELLLPLPTGSLPLALTPDGRQLAVSVDARRVQVWDLAQVREEFRRLGIDWKDTE